MKVDDRGSTEFIHFPVEETKNLMPAIKQAEKAGDLKTLQWCARRLLWLYGVFKNDLCGSDEPFEFEGCPVRSVNEFNSKYEKELKKDPPPESIAAIITQPEPGPEHWSNCWKKEFDDDPSLDFEGGPPLVRDRADALALIDAMMGTTISDLDNGLLAIRKVIEAEAAQ